MKVLLIAAANRTTGGAERHVVDLLRGLPEHGIEPVLLCPDGGDLGDLARNLGIGVLNAEIAEGFSPSMVRQVRAAMNRTAPVLVHAHGSRAAMFARIADRRASTRLVYTVHGIHMDQAGSAMRQAAFLALERRLKSRTARFVTVCESDISKGVELRILTAAKTVCVHNGIDVPEVGSPDVFRRELDLDLVTPLVLSIGRFHQQKDQRSLLKAWSQLHAHLPGAVLALVGSGPLEAALREQAVALGLGDSMRFVTPRADLEPVYSAATCFVLSSLWEGLPYVVLEAMGYGLPVVSTNVDGIPEAVEQGVSGLLSNPGDPEALAGGILELLADGKLAARLGASGRETVRSRFNIETMVAKTATVYREVAP